jgi:hypothetical protein
MLIDAFHILAMSGFPIRDYQYTGFGSVYFVDFILFHKLLGIHRMVSIEHSQKVLKRVRFNRPYACIQIVMGEASGVIPTLSADLKHILWLDYDNVLNAGMLSDTRLAATYLSPGSMLLVTVDGEAPGGDGPADWMEHFKTEGAEYAQGYTELSDFSESRLTQRNIEILERAIGTGLAGRQHVSFLPLFNFEYADGHKMLTIGGMIVSEDDKRRILSSNLPRAAYARLDFKKPPYRIRIPRLTRKERMHLDANMPSRPRWRPKDFEVNSDDIKAYREIYPFLPAYAELLL